MISSRRQLNESFCSVLGNDKRSVCLDEILQINLDILTITLKMPGINGAGAENLLLFGPQISALTPARLTSIRGQLQDDSRLKYLLPAVQALPALWNTTIIKKVTALARLPGAGKSLEGLAPLLQHGADSTLLSSKLPNILLAPLTVIDQITEYVRLGQTGEVQGFCIGFLSAAAVSSAQEGGSLEQWATVALKLAVIVGAAVDLDEVESPSATWSVRWKSSRGKDHVNATLKAFSDVSI